MILHNEEVYIFKHRLYSAALVHARALKLHIGKCVILGYINTFHNIVTGSRKINFRSMRSALENVIKLMLSSSVPLAFINIQYVCCMLS